MWRVAVSQKLKQVSISTAVCLGGLIVAATSIVTYYNYTTTHLPPNISINSINVSNLTYEEALSHLKDQSPTPQSQLVTLTVDDISVASDSSQLGVHYNYQKLLTELKTKATTGRLRDQITWRVRPLFFPQSYAVPLSYEADKVLQFLEELNKQIEYPGNEPAATLSVSGNENSIKIFPGKRGRTIDSEATLLLLNQGIVANESAFSAKVASTAAELNADEINAATTRSKKLVGESVTFYFDNREYTITDKELVSFLQLPTGYHTHDLKNKVATVAAQLDRSPQEPEFEYNAETLEVTKFLPPLNGQTLNQEQTHQQLVAALKKLEEAAENNDTKETKPLRYELVVTTTPPSKNLADTNDLGIKERIGFGDSHYDHSIPNRIHNVAITTERISNVIVPPGSEFSFNKTLGEVSAATGFRSAYVIKNGQTSLGDGGGVCQVSTTVFRSVLDAGLKVTRRLPHSYRVSYYELDTKPGVDATVYSGETDFRFINDTGKHILLHGEADSKNLYMFIEIYGTSDGRSAEIVDHITWNPRSAPAPQYFPDPSLPAGKLVQIDWAASGISSSFVNVIKDKDGKIIREDKYVSNYRPWAAKYRQGVAQ